MPTPFETSAATASLGALVTDATSFFDRAIGVAIKEVDRFGPRDGFWNQLPPSLHEKAEALSERLITLTGQIADAVRGAPLATDADQKELATSAKAMRAALKLRKFDSWETEILNDEDRILGVRRAGQSDDEPSDPRSAKRVFLDSAAQVREVLDLVVASRGLGLGSVTGDGVGATPARYRPGTAFIIMSMDPSRPELDDVADTVKEVFRKFDIAAVRADDIEHEGLITARILNEIETAEFLFADLTGERPNVYYEVGYAHALKRRAILFRKAGTGLHFDLAGYNCPQYENNRDLREKLTRRLQETTNREPRK